MLIANKTRDPDYGLPLERTAAAASLVLRGSQRESKLRALSIGADGDESIVKAYAESAVVDQP